MLYYNKYIIRITMAKIKEFIDGSKLKCSVCGEVKEAENNFFKHAASRLGYTSQCKSCSGKKYNKEQRYFNKEGKLKCRECKSYKALEDFHNDATQKYRKGKAQACKNCEAIRKRESRLKNYSDSVTKVLASLYNGVNTRSKGSHELSREYLQKLYDQQQGRCAISKLPMTAKRGKGRFPYNISVDQIQAGKGYTKENTQLVCSQVNMMKGTLSVSELVDICKAIIRSENG